MRVASPVPVGFAGRELLDYLSTRFSYLTPAEWAAHIDAGRISCNDQPVIASMAVKHGDVITCELPDAELPSLDVAYDILYEDRWLVAVNKPAGLRVHGRGAFATLNLIYHFRRQHRPAYPEASLVNRLDEGTSGVVLLARDPATLRTLNRQLADGQMRKAYLAWVHGRPASAGAFSGPIGPVRAAAIPRFEVTKGGRASYTRYRRLAQLSPDFALVALQPRTGRTHQLRVHLAHAGLPIVGDARYQLDDAAYLAWVRGEWPGGPAQQLLARPALHCRRLRFQHPATNRWLAVVAPCPTDLTALNDRLRQLAD